MCLFAEKKQENKLLLTCSTKTTPCKNIFNQYYTYVYLVGTLKLMYNDDNSRDFAKQLSRWANMQLYSVQYQERKCT